MSLDVLQPVVRQRRRRYRYRLRRLTPVAAMALLAFAAGAWAGARHVGSRPAAVSAGTPPAAAASDSTQASGKRGATPRTGRQPTAPPPRLVFGAPLLANRLHSSLAAASAILVDANTGRVLWALHPHERRPVASTTKIMTALIALWKLKPHDVITVAKSVPRVPLVREGLRAGEKVEAWKIFYSMLLYSGNDDALALALAAGGTKAAFLREMNAEANRLGLRDTHFVSPSGVVDEDNYSSAWDLAALTRVAMRNRRFRTIVQTPRIRVPWAAPTYSKIYINNNQLIGTYPGATGVKTGYTHKAGPCLVASATRGKVSLIAVVLDSTNEYVDARALLDMGFAAKKTLLSEQTPSPASAPA